MTVANLVTEAALALWSAQNLFSTIAAAAYRRGLPLPEIPGVEPNVAVILPVRGADNLARILRLLRAQQYRHYRIIASVESADDPAFEVSSRGRGARPARRSTSRSPAALRMRGKRSGTSSPRSNG